MFKKILLSVLFCMLLGCVSAQNPRSYIGVGVAYVFGADLLPTLSVQIGTTVTDSLEVRATLDSLAIVNTLGADVLYTLNPHSDLKVYLGGGLDYLLVIPTTGSSFDLHGTAGVEFRPGDPQGMGIYAEVKPLVLSIAKGSPAFQGRAGLNFPF